MIVNYDIEKINGVLLDFYNSTGINMDLLKADFTPVSSRFREDRRYCARIQGTKAGKEACLCSDAALLEECARTQKPCRHLCHGGLVDVAVPILYNEAVIGYIIFGQMRTDRDPAPPLSYLASLGLPAEEMAVFFAEIPFADSGKLQSISNIAAMLAEHILLENMLKPDHDEGLRRAATFIEENLEKDLSIRTISRAVNLSKSVLYKRFHQAFGCTVSAYVNGRRVERAADLLKKTDLSLEEIARRAGFSGGSYFSKTFKKQKDISPLQYRKSYRSK